MLPHSLREVSEPLASADQYLEHAKGGAVDDAETVLAALKRILENRIGTLEILHAIADAFAPAEAKPAGFTTPERIANKEPRKKPNLYDVQARSLSPSELKIEDTPGSITFVPPLSLSELTALEDRARKVPLHKLD